MTDTQKIIGVDGLIEFGHYLSTLNDPQHTTYTFKMPGPTGSLVDCSLDDVIQRFQMFCDREIDVFRVYIGYVDYQMGTLGSTDKEFKRMSQ